MRTELRARIMRTELHRISKYESMQSSSSFITTYTQLLMQASKESKQHLVDTSLDRNLMMLRFQQLDRTRLSSLMGPYRKGPKQFELITSQAQSKLRRKLKWHQVVEVQHQAQIQYCYDYLERQLQYLLRWRRFQDNMDDDQVDRFINRHPEQHQFALKLHEQQKKGIIKAHSYLIKARLNFTTLRIQEEQAYLQWILQERKNQQLLDQGRANPHYTYPTKEKLQQPWCRYTERAREEAQIKKQYNNKSQVFQFSQKRDSRAVQKGPVHL